MVSTPLTPQHQGREARLYAVVMFPGRPPARRASAYRRISSRPIPVSGFIEAYAGGRSFRTSVANGSTPGTSHFVHISSIFAWK
jgi:hypothetical protein